MSEFDIKNFYNLLKNTGIFSLIFIDRLIYWGNIVILLNFTQCDFKNVPKLRSLPHVSSI